MAVVLETLAEAEEDARSTCGPVVLSLEAQSLRLAEVLSLAALLWRSSNITELNVSRNGITGQGVAAVAEAIAAPGCRLRVVDLSLNVVGDEGAVLLAQALARNESVTELDLWANWIGDAGAMALASMLPRSMTLARLHLSRNAIGEKGARALAQALETNVSVIEMDSRTCISSMPSANGALASHISHQLTFGLDDVLLMQAAAGASLHVVPPLRDWLHEHGMCEDETAEMSPMAALQALGRVLNGKPCSPARLSNVLILIARHLLADDGHLPPSATLTRHLCRPIEPAEPQEAASVPSAPCNMWLGLPDDVVCLLGSRDGCAAVFLAHPRFMALAGHVVAREMACGRMQSRAALLLCAAAA